ncbi:hypothetical protein [Macrococcus capreoli]|uniref:hypothetical protein n=1 Tax=Macrococcus capreoli TaxID=2982690 RepID=UPI0021D58B85|nr:hypothetical protein [Macrococcus sp. TMW 2.2395]MCU7558157.1 hypothetical protein [Macrococcus sp. TMW 2.2395]
MKNNYLNQFKEESYESFRGIDVLYVYLIVIISVGVGFLHIVFNDIAIFKYFPISAIISYLLNLLLCILVFYIWYNRSFSSGMELEKNFNIIKELSIYFLQFIVLYFMPITSLLHGFAFMNYEGLYEFNYFLELIKFTFILMILNMLIVIPTTRNMFKWHNILLSLLLFGVYLFYYFKNNHFLYEIDKTANFEVFSIYPYILFVTFVMSFRIGGNFFGMLMDFGYWDKKFNDEFNRKHFSDEEEGKVKR